MTPLMIPMTDWSRVSEFSPSVYLPAFVSTANFARASFIVIPLFIFNYILQLFIQECNIVLHDVARLIFLVAFFTVIFDDVFNNEVDDGEGEDTDDKTNDCVNDSVFGLFELTSVAGRGHVLNATDNDEDYSDKAGNGDDTI